MLMNERVIWHVRAGHCQDPHGRPHEMSKTRRHCIVLLNNLNDYYD